MSDATAFDFGKFLPGFDFLQKLATAKPGAASPGLGGWIAPTASVEELDKRIKELRAVLFWLEQNGTALKATIQALEVQKMTLAALAGMNLNMAEVAKAFTLPTGGAASAPEPPAEMARPEGWPYGTAPAPASAARPVAEAPAAEPAAPAEPQASPAPATRPAAPARKRGKSAAAAPAAAGLADPMQWWGALTQQFQHIAANALRDAAPGAAEKTPDSIAAGAGQTSARAPKQPEKKAAAKRPAKKAAARQRAAPAAKKAAQKAPKKAPAKKAAAPQDSAPKSATGWPLPPPFKLGR